MRDRERERSKYGSYFTKILPPRQINIERERQRKSERERDRER